MMRFSMLLLLCAAQLAAVAELVSAMDNGLAAKPPMGWRSWNCFLGAVSDTKMRGVVEAVKARGRSVNGVPTSLADLGYTHVGIDDGWQACGAGSELPTSFHDAAGTPLVNKSRFPDIAGLVSWTASKNLTLGWYINNCICHESKARIHNDTWVELTYRGDVQQITAAGFGSVKIDSCGLHSDLSKYADYINRTGHPVLIENCHQGGNTPTNQSWCPYNIYRTSNDIRATFGSIMGNLQTVRKYIEADPPLSFPGCWAYPDMMQVGNLATYEEDRTHFGAWCVVSSPLVLGLDVTNATKMDGVWDIISNKEAIAVNQNWVGHSGQLVNTSGTNISSSVQVWLKKQPHSAVAVLILNRGNAKLVSGIQLPLAALGLPAAVDGYHVRSIWGHKDLGNVLHSVDVDELGVHDSVFLLLTPS